jgi:hypothetical protein
VIKSQLSEKLFCAVRQSAERGIATRYTAPT